MEIVVDVFYCLYKTPNKYVCLSVCLDVEQARRSGGGGGGGGSRGSNKPPMEVNNGGLKIQTVDFQFLANSGGMENKIKLPCKETLIVL